MRGFTRISNWNQAWIGKCAIAFACTCICYIENTGVVCCMPKRLSDMFPHLLMTPLFSTLLITHFSIDSLNVFYAFTKIFDLDFFFHTITFSFSCACYLFIVSVWVLICPSKPQLNNFFLSP